MIRSKASKAQNVILTKKNLKKQIYQDGVLFLKTGSIGKLSLNSSSKPLTLHDQLSGQFLRKENGVPVIYYDPFQAQ